MSIDYSKYFNKPLEKEKYVVQLKLVAPKKNYDLNKKPEEIDIEETFGAAIERFNMYKARNNDGAKISEVKIDSDSIYFMLEINMGKLLKMRALIGNSLSKWLYKDYEWRKLVDEKANEKNKLFIIDYKNM